jgi:hypothetical protein
VEKPGELESLENWKAWRTGKPGELESLENWKAWRTGKPGELESLVRGPLAGRSLP